MKPVFDNGVSKLFHTDARSLPLEDKSVHWQKAQQLPGGCVQDVERTTAAASLPEGAEVG